MGRGVRGGEQNEMKGRWRTVSTRGAIERGRE